MHRPSHFSTWLIPLIAHLLNAGQTHAVVPQEEWAIRGDCPEPPPIHNAYRTVDENLVSYKCAPGTSLESGSLDIACNSGNNYSPNTFPTCVGNCGTPQLWTFANIDSSDAQKSVFYEGETVEYHCNDTTDVVAARATCQEEDFGWKLNHPICMENNNFASAMDYDFGDGVGVIDGDCVWVYNSSSYPTIGLKVKDPLHFINVYIVEFLIDDSRDTQWLELVYLSMKRNGHQIGRYNMSTSEDPMFLSKNYPYVQRSTDGIYLETRSASSIGICSPVIQGRTSEGGCGKVIPPFKTKLRNASDSFDYMPDDIVYLECYDGFHYVGGNKYLYCDYFRHWVKPNHFMECTDRKNHAIDNRYSVRIIPQDTTKSYDSSQLNLQGEFTRNNSDYDSVFLELPEYAASIVLNVSLRDLVDLERITIELSGEDVAPVSIMAFSTSNDAFGKECDINDDLTHGISSTFFCATYPRVNLVQIVIESDSDEVPLGNNDRSVKYLAIIGQVNEDHGHALECYYEEFGRDYKGFKNTSIDGQPCLPWASLGVYQLSQFPDKVLESHNNFCRNPDPHNFANPFCETTNGPIPCSVPPCERICSTTLRGDDYLGYVDQTKSLHSCLEWSDSEFPFKRDSQFHEESADEAYRFCRNPGLSQTKPWCYISKNPVEIEHCIIPYCPKSDEDSLDKLKWFTFNVSDFTTFLDNFFLLRCFAFDYASSASGKSAWVDVTESMVSEACDFVGPGMTIQTACVTQRLQNETIQWNDWQMICPEIPTTTTVSTTTTTSIETSTTDTETSTSATAAMTTKTTTTIKDTTSTTTAVAIPPTTKPTPLATSADTTPAQSVSTTTTTTQSQTQTLQTTATSTSSPPTTETTISSSSLSSSSSSSSASSSSSSSSLSTTSSSSSPPPTIPQSTTSSSSTIPSASPSSTASQQPATTSPTHNPYTTQSPNNCSWTCPVYVDLTTDPEAVEEITEDIVKELTVDKSRLSSTVRGKTCAEDNRASAVTTGYLGVCLLLTIASFIIVPDVILLFKNLRTLTLQTSLLPKCDNS